jgi:molybdopterin converting factor subunit 1
VLPYVPRMLVHIRLFASLREAVGQERLEVDLPEGATAEAAWRSLAEAYPSLSGRRSSLAVAVNRAYAPFDAPLAAGDEVVFIPPISGG